MSKSSFGASYYDKAVKDYNNKVNNDLAMQTAQASANKSNQLQQAYIQRMQNQQALNNNLAQSGIVGGATETANVNLMNTYATNRNTVNSDYNNQVTQLRTNANDNKFNYAQQMNTAKAEYLQNLAAEKRANAREDLVRKKDYAREDALKKRELKTEYYNSKYAKSFNVKSLKKALKKKGLSVEHKTAINNRIAYLRELAYNEKHKK